jgi:hypothetical protein
MTTCPNCLVPIAYPAPVAGPDLGRGRQGTGPVATRPQPPRECPNPACKRPYPPGWHDAGTTSVVMAGARTAGKSIYLAVMIKQLEQYGAQVGMDVAPLTPGVRGVFEEHYLKPLYTERGIMGATQPVDQEGAYQRESLVFRLTTRDGRHHHLVIRDVAGEDLERPDEQTPQRLAFFGHADTVFFLFDPLKINEVNRQLRGLVPEQSLGERAKTVFDTTLGLVQAGTPRLAVIMSKFDTLQMLRHARWDGEYKSIMQNAGAAFFRDPGPLSPYNDVDSRLLDEEVRSLLMLLGEGQFVAAVERATRRSEHRFFAVSALGDPPNGQYLNARGIAPFRCLDPLRWALAGTGIME